MHPYVRERLPQLVELCRKYHVKRLDLFGSGTGERFDAARSDVDFLVEYLPEAGFSMKAYFDFKRELKDLFRRDVNLVESTAVRNRYFREELDETKELLYAA